MLQKKFTISIVGERGPQAEKSWRAENSRKVLKHQSLNISKSGQHLLSICVSSSNPLRYLSLLRFWQSFCSSIDLSELGELLTPNTTREEVTMP